MIVSTKLENLIKSGIKNRIFRRVHPEILALSLRTTLEAFALESSEKFDKAKIKNSVVIGNPENYYIANYWKATHYSDPGHIPGAIQYTPKASMKLSADLKTLPTDKEVVIYCYTGQTSAFLSAYLRVIGYDAKSLLYGTNGMIYNKKLDYNAAPADGALTVWSDKEKHDYDLVTD